MELEKTSQNSEPIVFECENEQGSKIGVFEDDGTTGYLYLVDPLTRQPEAACWLYNRVPAPKLKEALDYAGRGQAPPLPSDYKFAEYSPPRSDLTLVTIRVCWNSFGTAVWVKFQGTVLGLLAWDGFNWQSYPWLLDEPCKWGKPLTQDIADQYNDHFAA
jgi:hypothetical protein